MKLSPRSIRFVSPVALALFTAVCGANLCAQIRSAGVVSGVVRDAHGTPQMGAEVELLTPSAAEIATALTDLHGRYRFSPIAQGRYAVKATAASFLPTLRENLHLRGGQAVVNLTLNTLFEAAQWVPAQRRAPDETDDDWKWTLRSSVNRPILRWDDDGPTVVVHSNRAERVQHRAVMHATFVADEGQFASSGPHAALEAAGSAMGNGQWMVRSEMAQAGSSPAASLAAGIERQLSQGLSETDFRTTATARQLPELSLGGENAIRVATFVLRGAESTRLEGLAEIAAGSEMTSIAVRPSTGAATRLSAMRPFLTVRTNPDGRNSFAYRFATSRQYQDVNGTDSAENLPQFSVQHGAFVLENDSHNALAVERHLDHSWFEAAAYSDHFSHPFVTGVQATRTAVLNSSDAILDEASGMLRLAGRSYSSQGIHLAASHEVAPELWATIEFSTGAALVLGPAPFRQPRDLENAIASLSPQRTNNAFLSMHGRLARAGTIWHAAYRWQPSGTLGPVDAFDNPSGDAYLSIYIRQPICGHQNNVEAVFDVRNLLAEGYTPVIGADGRMFFVAQQSRSVRGGLAFTF